MQPVDIIYHAGRFMPYAQATLSVQDRGVMFSDGVYEVIRYDRGRAFALEAHVARLRRSLAGINLPGVDPAELANRSAELLTRNGLTDAKVYWQITRGEQNRDFLMPTDEATQPSVTLLAYPVPALRPDQPLALGTAIVVDDERWTRCWIKSLQLISASLARTRAYHTGAAEALFERHKPGPSGRQMTEGSATNLFIVRGDVLQTHPADGWVLDGITRQTLLQLAEPLGLEACEKPFTKAEMLAADEVLVCSTTQLTALTAIDGQIIGTGLPGRRTRELHGAYVSVILSR